MARGTYITGQISVKSTRRTPCPVQTIREAAECVRITDNP